MRIPMMIRAGTKIKRGNNRARYFINVQIQVRGDIQALRHTIERVTPAFQSFRGPQSSNQVKLRSKEGHAYDARYQRLKHPEERRGKWYRLENVSSFRLA